MRLDKWLKVSRLIKRRTVAKTVVESGRARLNGRPAKPATEVSVGDRLELDLGGGMVTVVVEATPESVPAAQAASLYRVVGENPGGA
jgi:ribosomal 50S subunit-recycling heat shock protein